MKLPKKITPCPIIESVVEIRFDTDIPSDAIFGVIYNAFKNEFSKKPKNLPILQLPADIRNKDPNLLYKPHYRLSDGTFLFQIGPKVISLVNKGEYVGWNTFFPKIKDCFRKIKSLEIIEKTKRLGLRYINFFEGINIYEQINLQLLLNEEPLKSDIILVRTTLKTGDFLGNLQISNDSKFTRNNTKMLGSTIDIDVHLEENGKTIIDQIDSMIEKAHVEEKELFFGLIKKEFLNQFNPEY